MNNNTTPPQDTPARPGTTPRHRLGGREPRTPAEWKIVADDALWDALQDQADAAYRAEFLSGAAPAPASDEPLPF